MLPFLRYLSDGFERKLGDAEDSLAEHFELSGVERAALVPSGQQGIFRNRIGRARTHQKKTALIEPSRRGVFRITERGMKTLASNSNGIDGKCLARFAEFVAFRVATKFANGAVAAFGLPQSRTTPEDSLEVANKSLRDQLVAKLSPISSRA